MTLRDKLVSGAIQYDQKQMTKRSYNPYALGIYLERIDSVCADIDAGKPVRGAILAGFSDRLLSAMLKAVGERDFTREEMNAQAICYR